MIGQIVLGIVNGLVWALIMMLMCLGFNLIFGVLDIVNLAHGEFFMIGALIVWFLVGRFGYTLFLPALLLTVILGFSIGLLVERFIFRPARGEHAAQIVASFGLSYILRDIALVCTGGVAGTLAYPISGVISLGEFSYSIYRVIIAGIALILLILMWALLFRTNFGLLVRASKQNRELAVSMGVPAKRIYLLTFGLGIALAGLSGTLSTSIMAVDYMMGHEALILSLIIVCIGGLGSLKGSAIASLIIGLIEGIFSAFLLPPEVKILCLSVLVVVLLFKPRGLFG